MIYVEAEDSQSICEASVQSLGGLIHEMVNIYGLCGDTLKILLASNPEAAYVEDTYGRLPLHVAVDREDPYDLTMT